MPGQHLLIPNKIDPPKHRAMPNPTINIFHVLAASACNKHIRDIRPQHPVYSNPEHNNVLRNKHIAQVLAQDPVQKDPKPVITRQTAVHLVIDIFLLIPNT